MTTQTPTNAENEKWLRIRVFFSQIFDSGPGSEQKPQNPAGVDSGSPDPVPNRVQACNVNIEDEWTQRTALSTIFKTKIKSETFTWYCSTHTKCEINDADQHKRKIEEVFYKSAHGKSQIKEVLQNKRQTWTFFIAPHHKWQTNEMIEHKTPNIKGVSQCSSWAVRNERHSSKQISAKYKSFLQCSTSVVPNKSGSSPQAPNIRVFCNAVHQQCWFKE